MTGTEITHGRQHSSAADTCNADDGGQRAIAATFVALYGSIGFDVDPRTQFAWPAASNLGLVFPMYLTSVIAKANGKAWLRVSFEDDMTRCELDFFILASATQHVASQLFDVHIAAPDGQRRGILLDNNAFARIDGSITWTGSPLEKVKKLLGAQAVEAYQLSPSRTEELNDGLTDITNCLSMEIWPEVDCPSRLRLKTEVTKLSVITSCLWSAMY